MGAPEISITFIEKGISAIKRGDRGIVALGLKDANVSGSYVVYPGGELPEKLSDENKVYIQKAMIGYQKTPKKIILYVMNSAGDLAEEYTKMKVYFETASFNWLAIPTVSTDEKTEEIATWIKAQRANKRTVKAVLPNMSADHEGIVNVPYSLYNGETEIKAEAVTPRIAGLIAGTPMTISCTYAPLTDYTDCKRLTKEELDAAVDSGKLAFMWDGEKVKVCRGVNSFQTVTDSKGDSFKKIKIVEIMDMIRDDIYMTAQDNYIGKYANSYDNKCLLITAINAYFAELVRAGLLESGSCGIDIDGQRNYLASKGTAVEDMSDDEIKVANTGSKVFLKGNLSILDAMEDIDFEIYI